METALTARIVLSTARSEEEARRIARALVEERLAACVNVMPGVRSIYRWQGSLHEHEEWPLMVKTTAERLEGLEARLRQLHSYEVPELLVLAPESGGDAYLQWVYDSVSDPG